MSSVNKVFILGRLGKDPEIRYTADGKAVASISVATSTVSKDAQGNRQEYTEWHKLSAFNKAAEVAAKYLKKGDQLFVEGSLRTKKWTDQSGQEKYSTEIVVGRLNLLGGKSNNASQAPQDSISSMADDDMPF